MENLVIGILVGIFFYVTVVEPIFRNHNNNN